MVQDLLCCLSPRGTAHLPSVQARGKGVRAVRETRILKGRAVRATLRCTYPQTAKQVKPLTSPGPRASGWDVSGTHLHSHLPNPGWASIHLHMLGRTLPPPKQPYSPRAQLSLCISSYSRHMPNGGNQSRRDPARSAGPSIHPGAVDVPLPSKARQ